MTPERLRQCLPGCERFEAAGPDTFAATMRLGVAIFKGTYTGVVRVTEQHYPERLVLTVEGGGLLGSLVAAGTLHLHDHGHATELRYQGDAQVGGRVGSLPARIVSATAERLIQLFFDCVAARVAG